MYYQRNRSKTILHVLAALLLSAAMAAAAVPGLCNTGLSNGNYPFLCTGPIVAPGLTDANWTIAVPSPTASSTSGLVNPCGVAPIYFTSNPALTYVPAWVDTPDPSWLPNNLDSAWITPQVEDNLGGQYVYAITFPVPAGYSFVTIVGQLLSDNEVWSMYLSSGSPSAGYNECLAVAGLPYNGTAVNSATNFTPPWTTLQIVKAPVTAGGTATLYIVGRNRGAGGIDSDPTSTGLRVVFDQTISTFLP
jgi:hypothetical protein